MHTLLPPVGSLALLDALTQFVPDQFIDSLWPRVRRPGARLEFSAAQLWRVHLLAALTGGQSFNAVQRGLYEHRVWRRFAHLRNERSVPDVRMLHEFRSRVGVSGLRSINDYLARQILTLARFADKTVALIDATDLPARTCDKKKGAEPGVPGGPLWEHDH